MKRVIVLGKGDLAIRVANWFLESRDYTLIRLVPVIPEPSWAPSIQSWATERNLPVVASGHYKDIPEVQEQNWRVDLAVSVFYDKIIKDWFIARCGRILNIHNGPLPRYRGVSPINWALKNGEAEHGITIHEITPGIDDGPIVGQLKYSIYPEFDEVIDVYERSIEYGWALFQATMPLLPQIAAKPQDESQALYYSRAQDHLLDERKSFRRAESQREVNPSGRH